MFTIRYAADDGILHQQLEGFWTLDTAIAFSAERRRAVAAAAWRDGRVLILTDATAFPVQAKEVSEAMAKGGAGEAARTAIVVGSTLAKMQAERTLDQRHFRMFTDRAAAKDWLLSA